MRVRLIIAPDDLEQIGRIKVDSLLNKPFTIAQLLGAVREALHALCKG